MAGVAAQIMAEIYWEAGASVRLLGVGVKGGPLALGAMHCRNRTDELIEACEEWAKVEAAPIGPPSRVEVDPAVRVVWISDFLDASAVAPGDPSDLAALIRWGLGLVDEGGTFAALHVWTPEEHSLVGLGLAPGSSVTFDRLAVTPAQLREAMQRHVDDLRLTFARAGVPFASLSPEMTGATLMEEIAGSGMLDREL